MLKAADLFCGAGGTTEGAHRSGKAEVRLAVNHWRTAVQSHSANHPNTRHICAEIDMVDPRDFVNMKLNAVFASPECVYHSNAAGGRPVDDQRRATAWCVPRWAETLRPDWLIIENVREFEDWGPLGRDLRPMKSKKGEIFQAWVNAIRALNYHVEWKVLNAADFGGATKRHRLFVMARRGRSTHNMPWPKATHTRENWTPAYSVIDWSLPCPSIFGRKRPLAEKTLARIEAGLKKFVAPFVMQNGHTGSTGRAQYVLDPNEPLRTVTTRNENGVVIPFVSTFHNGPDGANRNSSIDEPVPTLDTQNRHAVVLPFMLDIHNRRRDDTTSAASEPFPTIVTKPGNSLVLPFITSFFSNGKPQSVLEPLSTVTTKHRHGLAMVKLLQTMESLGVADIGFRMFEPHELAMAQGFSRDYQLFGSKAEQVKQIGNSVHTHVAEALCRSIGAAA